jgi:sugar phosphate isomerase/epimerase
MKKLSIGSWAYLFNQETPTKDFHRLVHKLADLGYEGVELGAFEPHPNPQSFDSKARRQDLGKLVRAHGLEFSALATGLRAPKLWSVADPAAFIATFSTYLSFAQDLSIATIRVDTVEPISEVRASGIEPERLFERCVHAFDRCAKRAAGYGITIAWEFEPGYPLNKPSEILALLQAVREEHGNSNFGALYDTCHAHMCAAVGASQIGVKETLPGGALELLRKLKGKIAHLHLIDSDGTLNTHHTSTHVPFGKGVLDFDKLVPELLACGVPNDWWCVDLCFWPNAWDVTAESQRFLDKLRHKYVP